MTPHISTLFGEIRDAGKENFECCFFAALAKKQSGADISSKGADLIVDLSTIYIDLSFFKIPSVKFMI